MEPKNREVWMDTSARSLKQWSAGMWVEIPATYIKISAPGIGKAFSQFDGITIAGLKGKDLTDSLTGEILEDPAELAALEGAPMLMTRGVLYTAITRARDLFIVVGDDAAVVQMIHNDRQTRRYSGLKARLLLEA